MAERNADVEKILKHFLDEVQHKYRVVGAYLYGSFAKGTSNKWSDIDVAIISPDFSDDLFEDGVKIHFQRKINFFNKHHLPWNIFVVPFNYLNTHE